MRKKVESQNLRGQIKEKVNGKRIAVVGLGNIDRGDDGYGIKIAKMLKRKFPYRVFMGTDGLTEVIKSINESEDIEFVLFADAVESGNKEGMVHIIKSDDIEDVKSSHKIPLKLYTAILDKPSAIIGVHPENVDFMQPISETVNRRIKETVDLLISEMKNN